ncbi:MAG: lipopolysaccharide export system protein LptC [Shewanella sp.]|jgi:lipopolysaccharide export system protein LptC|uniref:LPS export ABC transporter periplasmic protein LptC n=1 Tax=unclassified Shewanella TaxID=196818 RepID=UPI001A997F53|nr:LPS export ABC transporter periplasmic protein LptC [Shewanella sp. 4t3-1-2LB]MBO1273346.1 LPS export ABC transporter periplasmic protein LptC [Shewanella sp. 4t3-1-2LB]MDN5370007.1 lipopolysaccharide export system protein LptC [Shewanella sp.]
MNRVTLAIIAFFTAALILYWQVQNKRNTDASLQNSDVVRPDYVADDLHSVSYDENGMISSRVSAKHMEHYEQDDRTVFSSPVYWIFPDKGQAEWRMTAEQGLLDKRSNKVVLENNVIIDAISPTEPIQSISTSYLELNLSNMIMTSDKNILVKGQDFDITGQGLYADLNAQQVKLLSQVKGTYETK